MGDISEGVADTLKPAKKIYKKNAGLKIRPQSAFKALCKIFYWVIWWGHGSPLQIFKFEARQTAIIFFSRLQPHPTQHV
jgi:hypothetical protein